MKKLRSRNASLALTLILIGLLVIFQNCGSPFAPIVPKTFSSQGGGSVIDDDVRDPVGVENPEPVIPPPPPTVESYPENPVPANAQITVVSEGYGFLEGPAYDVKTGNLIFSDVKNNRLHIVNVLENNSIVQTLRENTSGSNGNAIDNVGRLITMVGYPQSKVVATDLVTREITEIASQQADGLPFNGPNDVDIFSDNSIYFTDPCFCKNTIPAGHKGVYRIRPNGDVVTLITSGIEQPNGIVFSPDYKKLYIADYVGSVIQHYDVDAAGAIDNGSLFFDLRPLGGAPDGLAIDKAGNLYIADNQHITIVRPNGNLLTRIFAGERVLNCTFGGKDGKTLFITAETRLLKIDLLIPGK